MSWTLRVAKYVPRALKRLPPRDRERIAGALREMKRDPLSGDVVRLKGFPKSWRRRVGDYRILFDLDRAEETVDVTEITRRTTTT